MMGVLTVCSFHTPPGASWGEVKPSTLTTIAQRLQRQPPPLIFGIDANCLKTDHPDEPSFCTCRGRNMRPDFRPCRVCLICIAKDVGAFGFQNAESSLRICR